MSKVPVTEFSICSRCKRRGACKFANDRMRKCMSPDETNKYSEDRQAAKEQREIRAKQIEGFLSKLKRTERGQVRISIANEISYTPKGREERRKNSRGWSMRLVEGTTDEYVKWCENCGAEFSTINSERRICDACWEEICNLLGVRYAWLQISRSRGGYERKK